MKRAHPLPELSDAMRVLLDRLRDDGSRVFGSHPVEIVPLTFQIRESSEVTRARCSTPSGPRHVFAKVFRPRPREVGLAATRARFRKDCEVTRHIFDAMAPSRELRSVEPLVCYEDLLGVVTDEAPGVPLNLAISRDAAWPTAADRFAVLETAVSRVGRWIALFQSVALDFQSSALDLNATRQYIDVRLTTLTELPTAAFSEADRRAVLAYFDQRAAEVPSADLVEVPVHGDTVPSNIVTAPDRITVLDFAMTTRGSKYLDIARLCTQLEFYRAKPQFRPWAIGKLQASAIAGFQPGLTQDHPLLEICAVQHVVCHLLSHARQPGRFPASLYSRHLCRLHRRWLAERMGRTGKGRVAAPSSSAGNGR